MASATLLLGTPQVAGPSEGLLKSQGALPSGKVSMFLQLRMGCVLQAAKELIFYSLASFSQHVYLRIQFWVTVVSCLCKVKRDAGQTIKRMFLAGF